MFFFSEGWLNHQAARVAVAFLIEFGWRFAGRHDSDMSMQLFLMPECWWPHLSYNQSSPNDRIMMDHAAMTWLFKLLLLQKTWDGLWWFPCFHTKNRLCWSSVFPAILTPAMRLDLPSPGEKRAVNNPEPGEGPNLVAFLFIFNIPAMQIPLDWRSYDLFHTSEPNPSGFSCPLSWSVIIYHHPQKVMIYNDNGI